MSNHPLRDQMNRTVVLPDTPRRIISLVPSQTELLHDLGLEKEVVGITKFCVHPQKWFRNKPRIGGTKKLHIDKIRRLQPDLIIGNKEENSKSDIEALEKEFPVWMSDVRTIGDACRMIEMIGDITHRNKMAIQIRESIQKAFDNLHFQNTVPAAYLIWRKPYMVAAADTFINNILTHAGGFSNVFESHSRYPEVELDALKQSNPAVILLSSEPYPFKEKHIEEFEAACPDAKVKLVDGQMFSWYGSRLTKTPEYLKKLHRQLIN